MSLISPAFARDRPVAASGRAKPTSALYTRHDDTLILLRRTACYGWCPIYSLAIRGDGEVFYYGSHFTKTLGFARAHVDRDAVDWLLDKFRKADFLSKPDYYPRTKTDHPHAVTTIRRGDQSKTIDRDGSNDQPAIEELEEAIDKVARASRWIGGEPHGRDQREPPPLTMDQVKAMIGDQLASLEYACKGKRGEVRFRLATENDGRLRVIGFHGDTRVAECGRDALDRIRFPLPDAGPFDLVLAFTH